MDRDDIRLLWQAVDYWAEVKPEGVALAFEGERITWSAFKEQVDRTAKAFLELGVARGDRIAMLSMGRPEFLTTFMAASKVGAIWLGMSPKFTLDELHYMLGHCRPALLITLAEYQGVDLAERALGFQQEFPTLAEVLIIGDAPGGDRGFEELVAAPRPEMAEALAARVAEVRPDDEVLLMYTSGSTGKPKGVLHSQSNIIRNVQIQSKYFKFHEGTRALLHFPINHVAADVEIGYTTIYGGGTIVLMDRFEPQATLETIEREGVTALGQVPVMFLMEFQAPKFKEMDWSSVESFIWGGSALPRLVLDVLSKIASQTGAQLMTGYGSTELCGFATYSTPEDNLDVLARSAGKVFAPWDVRVVDEARQPLPPGTVGEVAVRGPSVMQGYLNSPEATAAVTDAEGWYYTSDLGCLDEEGYLFLSGRSSEMFKSGGENVFPREIEDTLETHSAVLFAAVIGVPDDLYAEAGHAFIMLKPGQTADEEALRSHCKAHLTGFKVPKYYDLRPQLPLLANGKVNKIALKKELGI